ncbi:oligopeptide ABC transporter ATP-binding protein [Candidatus Bathyarchaeota archaeon]|nr:MAG: oligopeptide ABC transporter ATP-binding protein [Candidatus Bathyarchaeota archaeon]
MMEPLLEVRNLRKYFPVRGGFFRSLLSRRQMWVKAVDDVSFHVMPGEIFGLAGESGCGKTTTGKTILKLIEPTAGEVIFDGTEIFNLPPQELKPFRRRMQIIYQDPYESLNPRMNVFDIISEGIDIHELAGSTSEKEELVASALEMVELTPPEEFIFRYPHELSGGQRQRVCIARALVLNPEFIVADEPVSMLDVSIRASILKLMLKWKEESEISYLFITHDLAVARHMCDRIGIMYLGKIVEMGDIDRIIETPRHPYTQALMAAVPVPDPTAERTKVMITGEVPTPIEPPSGCRFHPRCPYAKEICKRETPGLVEVERDHVVACHQLEHSIHL